MRSDFHVVLSPPLLPRGFARHGQTPVCIVSGTHRIVPILGENRAFKYEKTLLGVQKRRRNSNVHVMLTTSSLSWNIWRHPQTPGCTVPGPRRIGPFSARMVRHPAAGVCSRLDMEKVHNLMVSCIQISGQIHCETIHEAGLRATS